MPYKIAEKLKEFKDVSPDAEWSTRNRALLLSQIGIDQDENEKASGLWIIYFQIFRGALAGIRPVYALLVMLSISLGTGIMGLKAVGQAKPGDSLYSAKRVTEKAQLAMKFDEQDKAKFGIQLASRRANEMSAVVKSVSSDNEKTEQVKNLADDLKREIEAAKSQIAKVRPEAKELKEDDEAKKVAIVKKEDLSDKEKKEEKKSVEPVKSQATSTSKKDIAKKDDDRKDSGKEAMFIANSAKTEKGIAISEARKEDDKELENIISNSQKTLEAANESLTKNDYDEALKKLDEAGETLGEIK